MTIPARGIVRIAAVAAILSAAAASAQVPGIEAYRTNSPPGQQTLYAPYMTRPAYEPFDRRGTVVERARAEIDAGNYRSAQRLLSRVRNGSSAEPSYLSAVAFSGLGQLEQARHAFAGALAADESHVGARVGLALTDIRLGRIDEAAAALAELEARRAACAGVCNNAVALDRAVRVIDHFLQ